MHKTFGHKALGSRASFRPSLLGVLACLLLVSAAAGSASAQESQDPPGNRHLLDLKAEAGHEQATLTWDAASDAEKAKITSYEVQQGTSTSAMAEAAWTSIAGSDRETTTHMVTGLTNGTTYFFRIRATGPGGAGLASPPVSARPLPEVTNMAITSSPESGDTYGADEKIEVTVTFSEAVAVTGVPFLELKVGTSPQYAGYARGSGSTALVFAYTVAAEDKDTDGVSIPQNPIFRASADGTPATIRNAFRIDATTNHAGLSDQASHKVDGFTPPPDAAAGAGPTVTAMSIASSPASGDTYSANEDIVVEVTWSGAVYGFSDPEPTLNLTVGSSTVEADFVLNVAGTTMFSYTVRSGDADADGVSIPANPINLSAHHAIRGDEDRNAVLTYAGLSDQSGHKVNAAADTAGPTITGLGMFSGGGPYKAGDVIAVRVSFSETIVVTGTPTLAVTVGANTRTFSYAPKSHITGSAIFEYTVQTGDSDDDGISVPANSVSVPSGASIKDAAGNKAVVTHAALPAQDDHTVSTTVGGL